MKKIIVGRILKDNEVVGTGFLVAPNIVITAKHNLLTGDDIVEKKYEEKNVVFRINNDEEVSGITINLCESVAKEIDCVYIRLDERLCGNKLQNLIACENDITDYDCYTKGFPKLSREETKLYGKIVSNKELITVSIDKKDRLQNYEGLLFTEPSDEGHKGENYLESL